METFLKKSFPLGSIQPTKQVGHPIPIYSGHRNIATKRVCLVGDAANLVDPIMGEGIRFALKSAVLAADIITHLTGGKQDSSIDLEDISWDNGACCSYQTQVHKEIGADLDILYKYALPVFLDAPEFFYRKFIIEGHNYLSYFKHIAAQLKNKDKLF
jgi:flavin-dependent dehydrogenase